MNYVVVAQEIPDSEITLFSLKDSPEFLELLMELQLFCKFCSIPLFLALREAIFGVEANDSLEFVDEVSKEQEDENVLGLGGSEIDPDADEKGRGPRASSFSISGNFTNTLRCLCKSPISTNGLERLL
mmetsp:Transcript_23156/g.32626  ORF Transcript_23156/g.32626 Transcript_23156/m.32626 type:complete len:128 (+) Transcript_23156:181-564(+)